MNFDWDGKGADGKLRARGLYTARISYRDAAGKLVQTEETQFFHDRDEEAKKRFGAVEGQLQMSGGAGVAANTELELVDDKGKVVQRVRTTEQGNYLFKNVQGGSYKVRARKEGWKDQEQTIHAAPAAAPAKADFRF
jgi:squalene-hopene/tetraprenyl-beta-curcumene cyclase